MPLPAWRFAVMRRLTCPIPATTGCCGWVGRSAEMDVNWRWHMRLRGLLPLSPDALADDGRLVLVRPDELEGRKYQILQADKSGATVSAGSVTVETVHQMCVTVDAPVMIGVT